jgi:hypothetical protein
MQRPDIVAISQKWITELRLQDRLITVRYTTNLSDPLGNLVYGLMTILNLDEGRFLIEVQDPSTWPNGGSREFSAQAVEECIVHELVHIRYADLLALNTDAAAIIQEERATWATARALIKANPSQRAAMVRAMAAKPAAMRRQTKGKAMDAQAVIAALKEADGEAALKILGDYVAEQLGGANGPPSVPDPNAPPVAQDAGNDPNKDKPPMNMGDKPEQMMRQMKADLADIRAMKATAAKEAADVKTAADILRPRAKEEIVRAMKADGVPLTPHAEKLIIDAPTVEAAKDLEKGMRAMAPANGKRAQAVPAVGKHDDVSGLTTTQAQTYRAKAAKNQQLADVYRAECIRVNGKKDGAK